MAEVQEHILCFIKGGPIDHFTHVTVSVSQSSAEGDYNSSFNVGMVLAHFRMLNNELLNKDLDMVPEQATLVILDSK